MTGTYTVGEVARVSHVSVRTLHHYDDIGLLVPSARSSAGYRLYSDEDLGRLQQILFYRALDFGLDDIAAMLTEPGATAEDHLRRQHRLVREQIAHRQDLLAALEKEMEARRMGISLTPEEQFEIFGTTSFEEYQREAEQRWGDSDAWQESQRRSAAYTKQDWLQIKAEADANIAAFKDALTSGLAPDSPDAVAAAEEHRQHICRWFYDCDHEMHRGLAELYVSDRRYTAEYDKIAEGFSRYVHDAIVANAAQAGR